jgi:hypothetical protein
LPATARQVLPMTVLLVGSAIASIRLATKLPRTVPSAPDMTAEMPSEMALPACWPTP